MVYIMVLVCVILMSAAQLLIKKGMLVVGQFSGDLNELIPYFAKASTNAYIIVAVVVSILTALTWLLVVSKAQLSLLYPFMALSYVLVTLLSLLFLKEDVTLVRWAGIIVICLGVFLVSRS